MISLDRWQEIYDTMRRHKLRTFLTSLSVAWGIFMLVLLLGAGEGLRNYAKHKFRDDATNSLWIHPGRTSIPYKGLQPGRRIQLKNADYDILKRQSWVEHLTARYYMWGDLTVSYGDKNSAFDIRSTHPDHRYLEKTIMIAGRFLNDLDLSEKRKVAVIGDQVQEFLFGPEDPLGKYIEIGGISYRVIGVFKDQGGQEERRKIYVPITTAQMAYNAGNNIHALMFTMGDISVEQSKEVERKLREMMSARHKYAPDDDRALRVRNNLEQYTKIMSIFDAIQFFVWIVGAGTIVAGIVGVSNIMLISVKERTKEFGVRKSLGATPWSITSMVVQEAIVLTAVSGYMGLIAGIGILEVAGKFIDFAKDAQVDMRLALVATGLLVFFGALAGYFPARRAANVNPVVALRDE